MTNFVSYSNMTELMTAIGAKFSTLAGAYILKGSVAFSGLPATLTESMVGYVYDVNEEFTTDSRFKETGKKYPAGTNVAVAAVEVSGETVYKFDVMSGFIDTDDIYAKIAAAVNLVAPAFSATTGYSEGDYVIYGGSIWQFNAAHAAGAWVGTDADEIGDVTDLVDGFAATLDAKIAAATEKAQKALYYFAKEYNSTKNYDEGSFVIHEDTLYKCKSYATGEWNVSKWDEVSYNDIFAYTSQIVYDLIRNIWANEGELFQDVAATFLFGSAVAPKFNAASSYNAGDYVSYKGEIYKFKVAHTGTWATADVDKVTVLDLIEAAEPESLTETEVNTLIGLLD